MAQKTVVMCAKEAPPRKALEKYQKKHSEESQKKSL
jgi:hypothetical protein